MAFDRINLNWSELRRAMVDQQLRGRGIRDPRVLEVMQSIPREQFLPPERREEAYEDRALPIGDGQTISQPFIVAYMTQRLRVIPDYTVLEIGTGSAYQTAILASLCRHVHSVEYRDALHVRAVRVLAELNIQNVTLHVADGSMGLPQQAPFDRILVTAGAPRIPMPLIVQLTEGGILVLPVGSEPDQTLVEVVRRGPRAVETPLLPCRFVRLLGRQGWEEGAPQESRNLEPN